MTVQEYLKQFSYMDILPYIKDLIRKGKQNLDPYFWENDHKYEECKMTYDCICRIEGKPSKDPYLRIEFIDHRDIIPGYIGINTWDFELVPIAECASKEIRYDGNPGLFTQEEIAAKLVYDLSGWRYSLDGDSFQLDYYSHYKKEACLIFKRYAKHQLQRKKTRYFDEEWQDEYELTVFPEDRNIIEKRERRCNRAKRKRNFRVKNRIKQLEKYDDIDYLIRRLFKNNIDGLSYTDFKWLFQIKDHDNGREFRSFATCKSRRIAYLIDLFEHYTDKFKKWDKYLVSIKTSPEHRLSVEESKTIANLLKQKEIIPTNWYHATDECLGEDIYILIVGYTIK